MARHQLKNDKQSSGMQKVYLTHMQPDACSKQGSEVHPRDSYVYAPHSTAKFTGHAMLNVANICLTIIQIGMHTDSMHNCQSASAASSLLTWDSI